MRPPAQGRSDERSPTRSFAAIECIRGEAWHDSVRHHDDVPPSDVTVHRGIPCTTPIRVVIDIACDVEPDHLEAIIDECLGRRLFTLEEAWHRLGQPDMAERHGAALVRDALRRRGRV